MFRILFRTPGYFTYFVISIVALREGLSLVSTLRDGFVLIALPAFVARATTMLWLACGAGMLPLVYCLRGRPEPRRSRRASAAGSSLS
jgi:hypothetical protein